LVEVAMGAGVLEETVADHLQAIPDQVDQADLEDHLGPEALLGTKTQDFLSLGSAG
jgi:hypothetical protein